MKITKVNKDDRLPGDDNDPVYTHPRETNENSFCTQRSCLSVESKLDNEANKRHKKCSSQRVLTILV